MSCSRTHNGNPSGARTPTSGFGVCGVNHQATAPPNILVLSLISIPKISVADQAVLCLTWLLILQVNYIATNFDLLYI